jgi:CheY-like chemotaxis protein
MSGEKKLKVLVVDDEKPIRDFFTRLLKLEDVEIKTAEDGLAAIEAVKNEVFDLVFLDVRMPRLNGIQAFSQLKKINPSINCVFITGYAVEESLIEQLKQPQTFFLKKPFDDIAQIRLIVNKVLQDVKAKSEVIHPQETPIQERRAYLRLDAVLALDYRIKNAQQDFKHCTSKNAGPCGMLLCSEENLAEGTILELRIICAECDRIWEAEAKVVWNNELKDEDGCYHAGIEFIKINMPEFSEFFMHCVVKQAEGRA